jgi:hypothetical protein
LHQALATVLRLCPIRIFEIAPSYWSRYGPNLGNLQRLFNTLTTNENEMDESNGEHGANDESGAQCPTLERLSIAFFAYLTAQQATAMLLRCAWTHVDFDMCGTVMTQKDRLTQVRSTRVLFIITVLSVNYCFSFLAFPLLLITHSLFLCSSSYDSLLSIISCLAFSLLPNTHS